MRVLGVDFGFSRIGIAVGETTVAIATPRPALAATGTLRKDAAALATLAQAEEAMRIVLGVPEHHDDERQARICRKLGTEIEALGIPVDYIDESLTSVVADDTLRDQGLTAARRRKMRDGEAACIILERFFTKSS